MGYNRANLINDQYLVNWALFSGQRGTMRGTMKSTFWNGGGSHLAPFIQLADFIRAGEKSSHATCVEQGADKAYGIRLRLWIGPSVEKFRYPSWPDPFGVEKIFPQVR